MAKKIKSKHELDDIITRDNLFFMGGNTGNANNNNMQVVGGAAELGAGVLTGNPGAIVSGGMKYAMGNLGNLKTVLGDDQTNFGKKALSATSLLGPAGVIANSIFAKQMTNREEDTKQFNSSISERNNMLGIKANGGKIIVPMGVSPNMNSLYENGGGLTEFDAGSSHELNPYNGVRQGIGEDGEPNLVEQGETKWQDYIFSDRLLLDKNMVEEHNLPKSMEGKTFADASKKLSKLIKERPNDPISKNTHRDYMKQLISANDKTREIEQSNMMAGGGRLYDGLSQDTGFLNLEDPRILDRYLNPIENINSIDFKSLDRSPVLTSGLEMTKLNKKISDISAMNLNPKTRLGFTGDLSALKDSKNLRYAPIAFDALAATGLFGKSPSPEKYNPSLIGQQGKLTPAQIDEMQMRNAVDAAYQTGISGLSEASGGSGSVLRANLSGLNKDYMSGIGKSYADANAVNNASKMAADQINLTTEGNVASQNAQMMNQANLYNTNASNSARIKAYEDRMSYLGKAAEGIGDIGYEERLREIMPKLYGYDDYGNYVAPLKKSQGGRLRLKNHKK